LAHILVLVAARALEMKAGPVQKPLVLVAAAVVVVQAQVAPPGVQERRDKATRAAAGLAGAAVVVVARQPLALMLHQVQSLALVVREPHQVSQTRQ